MLFVLLYDFYVYSAPGKLIHCFVGVEKFSHREFERKLFTVELWLRNIRKIGCISIDIYYFEKYSDVIVVDLFFSNCFLMN